VLYQAEVGDHAFQPRVFLLELAEPPELSDAQVRELLLPYEERRLAHPGPPAHLADQGHALRWRRTKATCSSENFDRFIVRLLPQ